MGGYDKSQTSNGGYLQTVEAYDPTARKWECSGGETSPSCDSTTLEQMPTARSAFAAVTAANGLIYAIGGANSVSALNVVEAYDPTTNKWEWVGGGYKEAEFKNGTCVIREHEGWANFTNQWEPDKAGNTTIVLRAVVGTWMHNTPLYTTLGFSEFP